MDKSGSDASSDREHSRDEATDSATLEVYSPYLPADFEYWSKAAYWHPFEAACLSLGLGPMLISNATERQLQSEPLMYAKVTRQWQLTKRAFEAGHMLEHSSPHEWLSWFTQMAIPVPDCLAEWVLKMPNLEKHGFVRMPNSRADDIIAGFDAIKAALAGDRSVLYNQSSSTKEITSLEKLVISMAVSGYGHDPYGRRTGTAKEIVDDAAENGIMISEETVRKYLTRAAENHLPKFE